MSDNPAVGWRKSLKQIAEEGLARERAARKAASDLIRNYAEYGFGVEGPPPDLNQQVEK